MHGDGGFASNDPAYLKIFFTGCDDEPCLSEPTRWTEVKDGAEMKSDFSVTSGSRRRVKRVCSGLKLSTDEHRRDSVFGYFPVIHRRHDDQLTNGWPLMLHLIFPKNEFNKESETATRQNKIHVLSK